MAELTIRPEEIRDALERFVSSYEPEAAGREEVGHVTEAGDGIARVYGLEGVMAGELVEFAETRTSFTNPADSRTEEYVTGKFG